jgi:hypothetical protein
MSLADTRRASKIWKRPGCACKDERGATQRGGQISERARHGRRTDRNRTEGHPCRHWIVTD